MADSIDRVFAHALQTARKIPRTPNNRPPIDDRVELYGLYKQSMEGDVARVMPHPPRRTSATSGLLKSGILRSSSPSADRAELQKWDAWRSCGGMTKTEAKRRYIDALIKSMRKYTSDTEAGKALVDELEFVWEQVKGNIEGNAEHEAKVAEETGRDSRRRDEREELDDSRDVFVDAERESPGENEGELLSPVPRRVVSRESMSQEPSGRRKSAVSIPRPSSGRLEESIIGRMMSSGSRLARPQSASVTADGLRILSPLSEDDVDSKRLLDESDQDHDEITRPRLTVRLERAIVRLTAEVAALREQVDASQSLFGSWRWSMSPGRRKRFFWRLFQRAVFDLLVMVVVVGVYKGWNLRVYAELIRRRYGLSEKEKGVSRRKAVGLVVGKVWIDVRGFIGGLLTRVAGTQVGAGLLRLTGRE